MLYGNGVRIELVRGQVHVRMAARKPRLKDQINSLLRWVVRAGVQVLAPALCARGDAVSPGQWPGAS